MRMKIYQLSSRLKGLNIIQINDGRISIEINSHPNEFSGVHDYVFAAKLREEDNRPIALEYSLNPDQFENPNFQPATRDITLRHDSHSDQFVRMKRPGDKTGNEMLNLEELFQQLSEQYGILCSTCANVLNTNNLATLQVRQTIRNPYSAIDYLLIEPLQLPRFMIDERYPIRSLFLQKASDEYRGPTLG